MSRRVEKTLTHPASIKNYRDKCERHPWYSEASEMILDWSEKVAAIRKLPGDFEENIKILYKNDRPLTVEDNLAFARAIVDHPDVFWFYQDEYRRVQKDPDTEEFDPEGPHIKGYFESWFLFGRGLPYKSGLPLRAATSLIWKYMKGELPSVDGTEARAFAESYLASRNK